MSDNDDGSKVTLSRRKALAGLGTIGAASALGLGGTYAQFTDTDQRQVTFTAGGINGILKFSGHYNGNEVTDDLMHVDTDGGPGGSVHFTDIKPGDYGCINFCIKVKNNPAWVASCLGVAKDKDGKQYEPETHVDNNTPEGELAENILTLPYYDSDDECQFFDSNGVPSSLPNDFSVPSEFWSNSEDGSGPDDYLAPRTIKDVANSPGSLNTIYWNGNGETVHIEAPGGASVGKGCVFLDGKQAGGSSGDNTRGVTPLKSGDELYFGYDFHMPFDTGNVAQGDKMVLDFGFKFLQKRHTEAPNFGTYSPGSNTPNDS